ncbi:MAG: substrate-binding domain-containing protein [Caulobacteraceae bacterium]
MSSLKLRALAGVCALVSAAGLAASASAQTVTTISGGGSTLLGPYWAQAVLCFDNDTGNKTYLLKGNPVSSATTLATTESGCPHNKNNLIQFDATGSGTGQAGLLSHAAVISDTAEGIMFGNTASGGQVFPSIQYGISDNSLVNADLVAYDKGTNASEVLSFNGNSGTFSSATSYQGLTFDSTGTTTGGSTGADYPVAKPLYGPLIQFPASIDPVAVTFNPKFGTSSTFNIQNGGVLELSKAAYCGIFTGSITDWNNATLTALNGGVSLTGGVSVTINMFGRSDSSGTTSIFTRHLATVCGSTDYTSGTTTLPAALINPNQSSGNAAGLFNTASGSTGVAAAVNATKASIAYIGADFVSPASAKTGATPGFVLPAAALQNSSGNFEVPTGATALASFATLAPPQSTSTGAFNSSDTTSDRRDPTQWVQSTAANVPLANPTASGGYPIVGTTNFIAYTCYANAAQLATLENFLTFGSTVLAGDILNDASLGQLPSSNPSVPATWTNAIKGTFFPGGDAASLNLFFATAGSGSANTACSASGVVGG